MKFLLSKKGGGDVVREGGGPDGKEWSREPREALSKTIKLKDWVILYYLDYSGDWKGKRLVRMGFSRETQRNERKLRGQRKGRG